MEPFGNGHHMAYLISVVSALAASGLSVTVVTTPEVLRQGKFDKEIDALRGSKIIEKELTGFAWISSSNSVFLKMTYLHFWLLGSVKRDRRFRDYDYITIPYLDYSLPITAFLRPHFNRKKWLGVTMRQTFHFPDSGVIAPRRFLKERIQRFLFFRILKDPSCIGLCTNDPSLFSWWEKRFPNVNQLRLVHDPVPDATPAEEVDGRAQWGIPRSAKVILVYGDISARKGLLLLSKLLYSEYWPNGHVVLMVGEWSKDAHEVIPENSRKELIEKKKLILVSHRVDFSGEAVAFAVADAVWLCYENFYTGSGVLMQALACGLPVIALKQGVIYWFASRINNGFFADADPKLLCNAISQACGCDKLTQIKFNFDHEFGDALHAMVTYAKRK